MVDAPFHSEPHPDVAGYLLGTLEDGEAEAFVAHLPGCPACRTELDQLGGIAALLADVPDSWSLPPDLEARTMAAVERSATVVELVPARRRPRRVLLGAVAAVAAAVVIVAGVAAISKFRSRAPAPIATIRLISADGGSAHGDAVIDATSAGLIIHMTIDGLPAAPAGHFYTCWLVAGNDTLAHPDRVSVGSFEVRGATVHAQWTTAASLTRFPHLGITLEPDNGNPSHQGPKVLAGV
jgi:Anti-sigma-K factor rskA/Putative zinc-finger